MHAYRAYQIGADDRVKRAAELDCPDDESAIEAAKPLVDGHDIELWDRTRKVITLYHKK